MLVSPQKIRWLFIVKALIVPPSWIALLIWAFVKVPASDGLFALHATATGSDFSWSYLTALNVSLGFYATLAVNIPDFTVRRLKYSGHTRISADSDLWTILAICEKRKIVRLITRCKVNERGG